MKKLRRQSEAEAKRERELQLAGVPKGDRAPDDSLVAHLSGASIFKRMSGKFASMTKKFQGVKAKGK